jgi:hypothetical protein
LSAEALPEVLEYSTVEAAMKVVINLSAEVLL